MNAILLVRSANRALPPAKARHKFAGQIASNRTSSLRLCVSAAE